MFVQSSMSLREKIKEDIKKSMLAKDSFTLSILRMLNAFILNKEKEKRTKLIKQDSDMSEEEVTKQAILSEEEVVESVMSEVKKRKDAIEQFEKGGRTDLVENETKELEVLMAYAPDQMSEDKIREIVKETIKKIGATTAKDTGKVMGAAMGQLKGKADGQLVSKIVQQELKD